jgi:hypothetical protein
MNLRAGSSRRTVVLGGANLLSAAGRLLSIGLHGEWWLVRFTFLSLLLASGALSGFRYRFFAGVRLFYI